MWEISSYSQYICFVYSIVMGCTLCVLYDLFRLDRALFKRSALYVFFQDILFWVISAFVFYSFSVVFSNGQIRGYLLFGTALGFIIFNLTFSRLFRFLIKPVKALIKIIKLKYLTMLEGLICYLQLLNKKFRNMFKKTLFIKKEKNIKIIEKNS